MIPILKQSKHKKLLLGLAAISLALPPVASPDQVVGIASTSQISKIDPSWLLCKDRSIKECSSPTKHQIIGGYQVTSGFGPRTKPCPECSSFHRGVDVAADVSSPVFAVGLPGERVTVICKPDDGMGRPYSIQSASSMPNFEIEVLHLDSCNPGVYPAGAVHSYSGDAGTGPHYHIQVRKLDSIGDETNGLITPPIWVIEAAVSGRIPALITSR
jgi:murein DD-endopeptidase MepM/ murein hydrolase activator NlpD